MNGCEAARTELLVDLVRSKAFAHPINDISIAVGCQPSVGEQCTSGARVGRAGSMKEIDMGRVCRLLLMHSEPAKETNMKYALLLGTLTAVLNSPIASADNAKSV